MNDFANNDSFADQLGRIHSDSVPMPSAQEFDNQKVKYSGMDSLAAEFKQSYQGTAVGTVVQAWDNADTMKAAKSRAAEMNSPNLSVQELNSKYPGLEQPFSEPTNVFVAGEIARRQYEKQQTAEAAANGPSGTIYRAASLGVGLLAHALDPIELGAALLTGAASEEALGATQIGTKLGFGVKGVEASNIATRTAGIVKGTGQTYLQRLTTGAFEGTLANLATEPLKAAANVGNTPYTKEKPYDYKGALTDAVMGGVTFGLLKSNVPALYRFIKGQPENDLVALHNASKALLERDKIPNVDPVLKQMVDEQSGRINPEFTPKEDYVFKELNNDSIKGTKFYEAMDGAHVGSTEGKSLPLGDSNLPGRFFTDNPAVANGKSRGSVNTVSLNDTHLVPMNELPEGKVLKAQQAFLDKFTETSGGEGWFPSPGGVDAEKLTPKDVLDVLQDGVNAGEFHPKVIQDFYDEFKKIGRDGFSSVVDSTAGVKHDPYNVVQLFDHDHEGVQIHDSAIKNEGAVYKPQADELQELSKKTEGPESGIFHNPEDTNNFEKAAAEPPPVMEREDIEKQAGEIQKDLEARTKDYPDPEVEKMLEEIKENDKQSRSLVRFLNQAAHCLTKGG